MTAAGLVACLQERGFRLRRAGDDIAVCPWSQLTDADREALATEKAAVLDALDLLVLVTDVFGPGVRVVGSRPPIWPPRGGWIPAPSRHVDPYTTTPPSVPCPVCASSTWHRAGQGWTCARCHPPLAEKSQPSAASPRLTRR
jgi:hypothetical protein